MGKLIRNGIEYGGGNGTDIFKVTQAEYDALEQAGTLVHNALYVITDAPNLNATADDIEYSSGVTVKQAIDSKAKKTWTDLGNKSTGDTVDVSGYSEVLVWGNVGGGNYYNSLYIDLATLGNSPIYFSIYQSASYNSVWKLTISANTFTLLEESYQGWGSRQLRFMAR